MKGQTSWKLLHIFRSKRVNQVDDHENSSAKEIDDDQRAKPTDYAQLDIFHRAVYPIMLLGQCFAVMPLTGIWQANPRHHSEELCWWLAPVLYGFMDLFIIMISKGLSYRFEQISNRIRLLEQADQVPQSTFIKIREDYVRMCQLLERVDNAFSLMIIFNKLRWPINYVYHWYSMLFLVSRTACVFLTAATINDESKSALAVLRRVSGNNWCIEVERLIFQMFTQTVALSGKKFYFLTRRLLLGMAGIIVTYELVLLQFDEPNRRKGLQPLCA
ncbi:GH14695 [Drosophila grimshawi]|uniref:GH14695 n=1 Tax=Drosophila grimshawi TaxID=7222 RepID=B4IXA6_DROGR|nr:GH14695 [Drosophila grimshawi]